MKYHGRGCWNEFELQFATKSMQSGRGQTLGWPSVTLSALRLKCKEQRKQSGPQAVECVFSRAIPDGRRKAECTWARRWPIFLFRHFRSSVVSTCYTCYINILHKNYTYVIRKRNLTTSSLFQKFHYLFRPLRAIFMWYFWRFLTLLRYIHHLYKFEALYCFLICMYTMLRKFLRYTTFYIRITQNAYATRLFLARPVFALTTWRCIPEDDSKHFSCF
jgi:hypothetical protein